MKLYAGPLAVDDLVRETIGPVAAGLVAEELAQRWFFVRYADPHGHLRVRLAGDPQRLQQEVLPRLRDALAPALEDGRVWKLQLDTYEREVERYGGPEGIELCEQLFHHDSEAVVELLHEAEAGGDGDRRWRLALIGMDRLLDDLGLELETRRQLLLRARDAFHREFRASDAVARDIGAKYRAEHGAIAELLAPDEAASGSWPAERAVFRRRSQRSAGACESLRQLAAGSKLTLPLGEIAASLLHMTCNRLLRSAARTHELVLYDFLHRHYKGAVARRVSERRRDPVYVP